jgi:hypothetical protein
MRRCLLDVTEGHSGVERRGAEAVPQRVRADRLVDPSASRQASYNPGCLVSVQSLPCVGSEDRSFVAFSDSEVHGVRRAGREGDNDSLASMGGTGCRRVARTAHLKWPATQPGDQRHVS